MKKTYRCLLLALVVIGLGVQCKKKCTDPTNPECENYDPCSGKKPTSADFKILEVGDDRVTPRYAIAYETDTIIGDYTTFSAQAPGLEYRWEIGQGVYTDKQVSLDFNAVPNGATIPIKLVVKNRAVDTKCFPSDNGMDSVVKNMYVRHRCLVKPILDTFTYRGHHLDNPKEVLDVKIYYNSTGTRVAFENLIRERKVVPIDHHSTHYRLFCFAVNSHMTLEGSAFLNQKDSLFINYDYSFADMEPKKTLKRVFVGKKMN
jgi:hypothetical protein